jgi:serine-type D-Ala-D-Ala carboxypeptidase/endopeptidase
LSNNSATNCAKIANDLAGIFLGEDVASPKTRTPITLTEAVLDRYPGTYELAPNVHFVVTRRGAKLYAKLANQPEFEVFAEKENEFFYTVVDAQLSFHPGANGKAESLTLHQNGRDMPAKRIAQ